MDCGDCTLNIEFFSKNLFGPEENLKVEQFLSFELFNQIRWQHCVCISMHFLVQVDRVKCLKLWNNSNIFSYTLKFSSGFGFNFHWSDGYVKIWWCFTIWRWWREDSWWKLLLDFWCCRRCDLSCLQIFIFVELCTSNDCQILQIINFMISLRI